MKKMTLALVAVLTVTVSHSAFAGGSSFHKQRMARENMEYFQAKGVKDSGQPIAQNPDYVHLTTPQQRLAASNAAYFKDKPSSGTVVAGANKADYDFATTPAMRTAKRNYEYFSKK